MEVDKAYNFNDPLKLTVIFREPIFEEKKEDEDGISPSLREDLKGIGVHIDAITDIKSREYQEYSGEISVLWEEVDCIKTYPYKDDWKKYKGEKFYLGCYNKENDYLVLGNHRRMLDYWTMFRRNYPKY